MRRTSWYNTLIREVFRRLTARRWLFFLLGGVLGAVLVWVLQTVTLFDWRSVVAPLDQATLVIRQDAKGDGRFGAPRSGNRAHRGVDIHAPMGSVVRAIRSGTVVEIGRHRGLGLFLALEHPHELHSLYAHLNEVRVEVGDRIRQGQVIGTVGRTGNARHPWIQPHLHLAVHRGAVPINPASLGLALVEPVSEKTHDHADGGQ